MNISVWSDSVAAPEFKTLQNDLKCDTLVVGGGMAGILIAHFLNERGVDVVVCEGKKIGQGITKNTTAVITAQHDILYSQLAKKQGTDKSKQYLKANLFAVENFKKMAADCDLEIKPSVIYSKTDKKAMQKEAGFLNDIGYNAEFITDIPLPFSIAGGVKFNGMAQFHPLKFLYSVAKDLNIYENTFITDVKKNIAFTKDFRIEAKNIIIATHFPFINSKGLYFLKMCQHRSYVLGLENSQELDGTYTSIDEDGLYFRNYKNLLLVGGVDRRVGKGNCGYDKVREFTQKYYPEAKELYQFSAQDCITLDGVPYIGKYGSKDNFYVATGFNEWGMTSSMVSAKIISDMILGDRNDFSEVFCPKRSMLKAQLFKNIGTVLLSFITPTVKRCPHLGCALKFNRTERIWECACHGSRFNEDGTIIDNPAMKDAEV